MTLTIRLATAADMAAIERITEAAIAELQKGFLEPEQIAASHAVMGVDPQLVADGTYFVVEEDGVIAGCGGWSRRATLYGSAHTAGRDASLLDPARDPARVRAMYTDPGFTRRGVARMILVACERAAAAEGFSQLSLASTLSGHPLYLNFGFHDVENVDEIIDGVRVPLIRMVKPIEAT